MPLSWISPRKARYSELSLRAAQSQAQFEITLIRDSDRPTDGKPALNWRVLAVLNLYRVLVPLMLGGLFLLGGAKGIFLESQEVFFAAIAFYLCFGLLNVILVRRRLGGVNLQLTLQASVDIVVLTLLLNTLGGVPSGLGLLFLLPVGGIAFLLTPRAAIFLAAVATLAILGDTIWQNVTGQLDNTWYATAGLLGVVLFTIAGASSFAATRLSETDALVRQKDVDLANLADLSQYIVQHLRESILVVDAADRIRLINESAAGILGDDHAVPGALLGEVAPRLLYSLTTWRRSDSEDSTPPSFVAADGARVIQPHFAPLGSVSPGPTLIFMEDTSLMAERVQQTVGQHRARD
jgi:two-component system sensor histidine kinase PilS (NtrC family)